MTGKANAPQLIGLGPWRWPAMALALTLVAGASVLPFLALLVLSLIKAFGTELCPARISGCSITGRCSTTASRCCRR